MQDKVREFFNTHFAAAVIREENFRAQQAFYIKPEYLVEICEALIEDSDLDFKYLSDITCVDWLGHEEETQGRFEVAYNLFSISNSCRLFLKVRLLEDNPTISSLCDVWSGANWMEREVFDLFGITFEGHGDLTKILTPDELEGHPLRKDFPLTYEQPAFTWNKDDPPEVIK